MHTGSLESTRLGSVELPEARARLLTLPILECPKISQVHLHLPLYKHAIHELIISDHSRRTCARKMNFIATALGLPRNHLYYLKTINRRQMNMEAIFAVLNTTQAEVNIVHYCEDRFHINFLARSSHI